MTITEDVLNKESANVFVKRIKIYEMWRKGFILIRLQFHSTSSF